MTTAEITLSDEQQNIQKLSWKHRLIASAFAGITSGRLKVSLDTENDLYITGKHSGPEADMKINNLFRLSLRLLWRGDLGFAESYMAGEWESSDLTQLLLFLSTNLDAIENLDKRSWLQNIRARALHMLNSNTRYGSKKNIAAHYDLGNDFYHQWLDSSMTYSSALFENTDSLLAAQHAKYERILSRINPQPGAHILEIGCGWGGFAEYAASRGYHVTGITLSSEQLVYAKKRILDANLVDKVSLKLMDYRELKGQEKFDHIVSIEMFEAVGMQYWTTYFNVLKQSLKPEGTIVLQIITIDEAHFDDYVENPGGFIQHYIFPGGMLPAKSHLYDHAEDVKLKQMECFSFGKDYAKTLYSWHQQFKQAKDWLAAYGYDQRFQKMWRYYLSFCEAGFLDRRIDVVQVSLKHAEDL